jgi:alkyl hydroperoxide reductase subunit AhpF
MSILSDQDRETVRQRLDEELVDPVNVVVFSEPVSGLYVPGRRECLSCKETEQLIREVAELSDKMNVEIHNIKEEPDLAAEWQIELTPTISISRNGDSGVRFLGLPAGYEFASFLETVISASKGDGAGLQPETLDKLHSVDGDLDIKVFVTPT